MTKYCYKNCFGYKGFTDTKTTLTPEDDAAHVKLGGNWRMPSDADWGDLLSHCTWTRTSQSGVNCYLVTGNNGNSIFLPAAGGRIYARQGDVGTCGFYWSSDLFPEYPDQACCVFFNSYAQKTRTIDARYFGQSIRPVYAE